MFQRAKLFIEQGKLFSCKYNKLLFAISGGIDSVVMLDILSLMNCKGIVAHCNFQLRGAESDGDELFVKQLAQEYKYPFLSKKFDTSAYAVMHGISIQMAARELRFRWFDELCACHNLDYILLAQHKDDRIETFFINLLRGTGVKGLASLWEKRDNVVRPLLFAGREDINKYAKDNKLDFREDSSNASDKYMRNYLRHHVIPSLCILQPSFASIMENNLENFRFARKVYYAYFQNLKNELIKEETRGFELSIEKLLKKNPLEKYLYELLADFGFSPEICKDAAATITSEAGQGKEFFSASHRMLIDRGRLLLRKSESFKDEFVVHKIEEHSKELVLNENIRLKIESKNIKRPFSFEKNSNLAMLDKQKLIFPLTIRKWKQGDSFYPLGMKRKKKLSDFFIDNKFSVFEKESVFVVLSGNDIVWIVGYRIDDRYKVAEQTKEILTIHLQPE